MPHDWLVIFQLLSTRKRLLPRLLLSPSCALMNLLPYRNHYLLLLTLSLMPTLWGRRREWRCLSSRRGWRRQKRCKKRKMYRDAGKGWLYNCVKIRMKQNEVTSYTYVPVQTIESSMHPPPFICCFTVWPVWLLSQVTQGSGPHCWYAFFVRSKKKRI